jgi:stage V sporulation protein G
MKRIEGPSSIRAFVDVSFGGVFVVKGLRVVEGKNGIFVAMPGTKSNKDGKWYDNAYPLTKEFRDMLTELVMEAYENE